jgi:hypothetical protein
VTREAATYAAVSDALWLQRETLQTLLYRLVCEKLMLVSRANRWLARADDEVRATLDQLRTGELMRAVEVEELTRLRGLDADASLAELAAASPEPWQTVLADHRAALRTLVFEVQGVAQENRRLLEAGSLAVRATLNEITDLVTRYEAGRTVPEGGLR